MRETIRIRTRIWCTPQNYSSMKGAWGDKIEFTQLWDGRNVYPYSPVVCGLEGDPKDIDEMIQALGVVEVRR